MLERDELVKTAAAFGVVEEQVVRDHLISHVLFALADLQAPVVFFGRSRTRADPPLRPE